MVDITVLIFCTISEFTCKFYMPVFMYQHCLEYADIFLLLIP